MTAVVDSKKWFDVPDSKCKAENGDEYFNVEARFADHPILDVAASKIARRSVYARGIVLHTRVKKNTFDKPAIVNASSFVLRFDKGPDLTREVMVPGPAQGSMVPHRDGEPGMSKEDFDRAISLMMRCWEAWEYYQHFRESPVTALESEALKIIAAKPTSAFGRLVADKYGNAIEIDPIEAEVDDDPDAQFPGETPMGPPPVAEKHKGGRKPKAVAA
jgi:hypothetical protein